MMLSQTQQVVEQKNQFLDGRARRAAREDEKICNGACKWTPQGRVSFVLVVGAFIHMCDNGILMIAIPEALCLSLCCSARENNTTINLA